MKYTQYSNANDFLKRMTSIFEENELLNGLMFGVCLRLKDNLFLYGEKPLLAVVEENDVIHLAALMTPPHNLQLCAPETLSEDSMEVFAHGLRENGWIVPGIIAEKDLADSFAKMWKSILGCQYREGMKQLIHELRHVQTIDYSRGTLRQAYPEDLEKAVAWAKAFHLDCFGIVDPDRSSFIAEQTVSAGRLFFWEDSEAVSMAARIRPTPNGESIGFVYTPPEQRRHGYATSLVASLSGQILDDGKQFCALYTDVTNPTSNSIYRKIGYTPVCDVIEIHFEY